MSYVTYYSLSATSQLQPDQKTVLTYDSEAYCLPTGIQSGVFSQTEERQANEYSVPNSYANLKNISI